MRLRGDTRGQSEVIGAILVFAIIVAFIGLYQAFVIPQANEDAEFQHNSEIHGDLQELQSALRDAETRGTSQSRTLRLGVNYPTRVLALNPPDPRGRLQTSENSTLVIDNATAIDPEIESYWDGDPQEFDTRYLVYHPDYNEFRNAPRTYVDNSVVYNEFDDDTQITLTDQRLVRGNQITVGTLVGDRSFNRQRATIEATPVSAGTNSVPVRVDDPDENLTIQVPTQLDDDNWESLLEPQDNVVNVEEAGEDAVEITLRGTDEDDRKITYELRMAQVSVESQVEPRPPHYIVSVGGDEKAIESDQTTQLTAQVRDDHNNPVSGVNVTFSLEGGGELQNTNTGETDEDGTVNATSDENGQAEITYVAGDDNETVTVTAEVPRIDDEDRGSVTFDVVVGQAIPSGVGVELNPADGLIYEDAIFKGDQGQGQTFTAANVSLKNTLEDPVTIDELRVNVYVPQSPGESENAFPETMQLEDQDVPPLEDEFTVRGSFEELENVDNEFDGGETKWYTISFDDENFEMSDGDYFIISVRLDDGSSATYIVAPAQES